MNSKCGLGATYLGGGTCGFLVWAPLINQVEVHILSPEERIVPPEKVSQGYHYGVVQRVKLGTRYFYRLDGNTERPDPASKFQPEGVHGPSQANDPHFVRLEKKSTLVVRRWGRKEQVAAILHFVGTAVSVNVPLPHGCWLKRLSSGDERWNGPGSDLPPMLHSDGEVSLTLTQNAFLLVSLQPED